MSLIDIRKLNTEIDQMIQNQNEEIDALQAEYDAVMSDRYEFMMHNLKECSAVAREIGDAIYVTIGRIDSSREYYLIFDCEGSCAVAYETALGDTHVQFRLRYGQGYDRVSRHGNIHTIDKIVKWWSENSVEFERRFTERCVKAIRRKAEQANTKYTEDKARLHSAVAGFDK